MSYTLATKRVWSPVEDDWLRQNYGNIPLNQMTVALARAVTTIKRRIEALGLDGSGRKNINNTKSARTSGKVRRAGVDQRKVVSSSTKQGRRADLGGTYVRSGWEADVLRYLEFLKKARKKANRVASWKYEPYTFWFEKFKRGNRHYTPDVKVEFADGSDNWIEVKGHLRPGDSVKLRRFKKFYPEEFEKLIAVVGSEKTEAYRFFKKIGVKRIWLMKDLILKHGDKIPHWESH